MERLIKKGSEMIHEDVVSEEKDARGWLRDSRLRDRRQIGSVGTIHSLSTEIVANSGTALHCCRWFASSSSVGAVASASHRTPCGLLNSFDFSRSRLMVAAKSANGSNLDSTRRVSLSSRRKASIFSDC